MFPLKPPPIIIDWCPLNRDKLGIKLSGVARGAGGTEQTLRPLNRLLGPIPLISDPGRHRHRGTVTELNFPASSLHSFLPTFLYYDQLLTTSRCFFLTVTPSSSFVPPVTHLWDSTLFFYYLSCHSFALDCLDSYINLLHLRLLCRNTVHSTNHKPQTTTRQRQQ